jgi:16S rRNA (guanine1207-N2)-methyltransferase
VSKPSVDAATRVMIDCLDAWQPILRPLIVDERSGLLAAALRKRGAGPEIWLRQATPGAATKASPWPEGDGYDAALIRLPKSKDALDLALHAAAGKVAPGGMIAVFGANDEGVRSASHRLEAVADDVATAAAKHHSRVLTGRRKATIGGLKASLSDWRRVGEITIAGVQRPWGSYPGTFAKGGLDEGTAFLIEHLPTPRPASRVLDFAAGTGVLAAAIANRGNDLQIDMIEADALALSAAGENVPGARALLGASLSAAGDTRYDLILSNPPIHDGIAESRHVLERLIAEAPRHLRPAGRLVLVVQRRVAVLPLLSAAFADARLIAENGRFTVATGEGPPLERSSPPGRAASPRHAAGLRASTRQRGPKNDSDR